MEYTSAQRHYMMTRVEKQKPDHDQLSDKIFRSCETDPIEPQNLESNVLYCILLFYVVLTAGGTAFMTSILMDLIIIARVFKDFDLLGIFDTTMSPFPREYLQEMSIYQSLEGLLVLISFRIASAPASTRLAANAFPSAIAS